MATKIIYFVRHGQSQLNADGIRQGPDGPLSLLGRQQARDVAEKLAAEPKKIQAIFSSPYQRARETAEPIAERLHLPITFSDLLVERKNPSEIVGQSKDAGPVKHIVDRIDGSYHSDSLRFSDEENFFDLLARSKKLLFYIQQQEEDCILMVTHSIFLQFLVGYMLKGDSFSADEYAKISYLDALDNTGVVVCTCTPRWFRPPVWKLLVWNGKPRKEL